MSAREPVVSSLYHQGDAIDSLIRCVVLLTSSYAKQRHDIKAMRSLLTSLFLLVTAFPHDAYALSGRTHTYFAKSFVPNGGGSRVFLNDVRSNSVATAAFDGERFLIAYTVDLVLHAGLFREGAAEPDVKVRLGDGPGAGTPHATWDGSRFLVFWNENGGRGAAVSRQGVVEKTFTFPLNGQIAGVAATRANVALLVLGSDDMHSGFLHVTMFGSDLTPGTPRLISKLFAALAGSSYLYFPSIVTFDTGFFVSWLQKRRENGVWLEELIGTRVNALGQALDTRRLATEYETISGIVLVPTGQTSYPMTGYAGVYSVNGRLLAVILDEDKARGNFVDFAGIVSPGPSIDTRGIDHTLSVAPDGTAVYLWHGSIRSQMNAVPFYTPTHLPRRRAARH